MRGLLANWKVTLSLLRLALLGTPMVADTFHPNRWDYVYYFKDGRSQDVERRHFIVFFEDEKVARVERPDGQIANPTLPTSPGA